MDAAAELQKVASMRRDSGGSRSGSSVWWRAPDTAFSRSSSRREEEEDDEEALQWAALERLPTCDRVRHTILPLSGGGEAAPQVVDVLGLGPLERRALLERLVHIADEDNERFLLKIKERIEWVGIDMPTIEVRFEHLSAEAGVRVGASGLPETSPISANGKSTERSIT